MMTFTFRLPDKMGGRTMSAPAREREITEEEWEEYQTRDEYDQPVSYEVALFNEWLPVYSTCTGALYVDTYRTGIIYLNEPKESQA